MSTYFWLNICFIAAIVAMGLTLKTQTVKWSSFIRLFVPLFALALVFNNVLTSLPIVTYDESLILGIRLGSAPIEDFMYCIGFALIVPMIWRKAHGRE